MKPSRPRKASKEKAALSGGFLVQTGAGNRNRTYDLIITNDALYQLSYSGMGREF